nr:hypothetical protein BaRGS_026117 [Batillaria attramentaria]
MEWSDLNSTVLGEWCATTTMTLTSSTSKMLVVFRSDHDTVSTGFTVTYESGISWDTPSSPEDYTIIIATCTSTFVLICGVIAFILIRRRLKRGKNQGAGDKATLQKDEERDDADVEKYQDKGGKSMFSQRIVPSAKGGRRQPVEDAIQVENAGLAATIAASAAMAASGLPRKEMMKEEKKREKEEEKKREAERKKEAKEKREEEKQKQAEEKRQREAEKKSANEMKTQKEKQPVQKTDGKADENTADLSAEEKKAADIEGSEQNGGSENKETAGEKKRKVSFESNSEQITSLDPQASTSTVDGACAEGDGLSETKKAAGKMVLLPTVVLVSDQKRKEKMEGKWDKMSLARQDQHSSPSGSVTPRSAAGETSSQKKYETEDNTKSETADKNEEKTKVSDTPGSAGGDGQTSPGGDKIGSTGSLEKDEGIHLEEDDGSSGVRKTFYSTARVGTMYDIDPRLRKALKWPRDWSYRCPHDIPHADIASLPFSRSKSEMVDRRDVTASSVPRKPVKGAFLETTDA